MTNPNPKKYAICYRKGKPVLVDRQVLRWRKHRKPECFAPFRAPQPKLEPLQTALNVDLSPSDDMDNGLAALLKRSAS